MAKHPHKLILIDNKTWKCMECGFFVHRGLTHILVGKSAKCWDCKETFTVDDGSLKEDKPRCVDCRLARAIEATPELPIEQTEEMTPERRAMLKSLGLIK